MLETLAKAAHKLYEMTTLLVTLSQKANRDREIKVVVDQCAEIDHYSYTGLYMN